MSSNRSNPWQSAEIRKSRDKAGILRPPKREVVVIALGLLGILLTGTRAEPAKAQEPGVSASARQQIGTLMQEKAERTPVQRKIGSRLLVEAKRRQGRPIAQALPTWRSSIEIDRDGRALVDIKADVTDGLLRRIEALGGSVVGSVPMYQAVRARIRLTQLEALATSPQVRFIRPADTAITNKVNTSEGDIAHRADLARIRFGVDGSGRFLCALSDAVDSLGVLQGSGDLPTDVLVLPGQSGSGGSEGTAMLEIMHDLAPGAQLGFATAFAGQASFAQNILDLRAAGCDVIVDDVLYLAEPVFQDGIIAQAVNNVVADGAAYFSSAGNAGNLNDGTSGVWEGDYVDSGVDAEIVDPFFSGGRLHSFGGSISNQLTRNAPFAVTLQWADPLDGSANDYDLCVLDSTLTSVLECSTNIQNGGQDPIEVVGPASSGERLVIINFANKASPRFLHLNSMRGRLAIATDGQTYGHAAAEHAFGVAAVRWNAIRNGPFTGSEPVEFFSSDGPRRVYFEADGNAITPGNFSATGGVVRQKPDIAAADGVSTATPGFGIFFGTSAAAPHAAAIAGLMLSLRPDLTREGMRAVFGVTAMDIEAPGIDRDSGFGIVDAYAALAEIARLRVAEATIDDTWQTVAVPPGFVDPVVLAGPPTFVGRGPGVVRLRNVGPSAFQTRFQEWAYLDGFHTEENVPFMIVEAGRHVLSDGSVWEAGRFSLGGTGVWQAEVFSAPFARPPALFLTAQTADDPQPVTVRARNVTGSGFEAALFEEEALMDGHAIEEVGYLAIHSPRRSGVIGVGGVQTPYIIQSVGVNHRFTPILSSTIKLEEEQSLDAERRHRQERLSVLALGDKLFAQVVTSRNDDTVALRRLAPDYAAPLEWGTVAGVNHKWTTVPLAKNFANPVVVATPVSARDGDLGVIRLRNVAGGAFELKYQEWRYLDGKHKGERVFYLVAEAGQSDLAGLAVEAGTRDTDSMLGDGGELVGLSAPFTGTPAVFTSVMTLNGRDPVMTRTRNPTHLDFVVTMQEEEASWGGHATETLGWIAIDQGSGVTSDNRAVQIGQTTVNDLPAVTPFGFTTNRRFPVVIADTGSINESDPVFPRFENLTRHSVELFLQEEQSADAEQAHALEDLFLFVAE